MLSLESICVWRVWQFPKFPKEGHKIRCIFGQKTTRRKLLYFKGQNLTLKVNFLCQKPSESLCMYFGAHFLLIKFFGNFNF